MSRINLIPGLEFTVDNDMYEIKKIFPGGRMEVYNKNNGYTESFKKNDLLDELFEGNLKFNVANKKQANYKINDLSIIDEKYRQIALVKYKIINEFLSIPQSKRNNETIQKKINNILKANPGIIKKPSIKTVYRWKKIFEKSNRDIRSLVPKYRSPNSFLSQKVDQIIDEVIEKDYKTKQRLTIKETYYSLVNKIADTNKYRSKDEKLEIPSYSTFNRRIKAKNPYDIMKSRFGRKYANKYYKHSKKGPEVERILERVEIDHTPVDLILVDQKDRRPIGRPNLTLALDKYSGYPLGYYISFDPPSFKSISMCLYHGIPSKSYFKENYSEAKNDWLAYGIPEQIVIDNGKEFIGRSFEDACLQLQINIQQSPIRKPNYKGSVERFFKTMNMQLVHTLPGTTFSNIEEKADYNPEKNACISLEEFKKMFYMWVTDVYAQNYNRGVKGVPSDLWQEGIKKTSIAIPPNKKELLILLSSVEHRTIQRYGIELHGLLYNSEKLIPLRNAVSHNKKEKNKSKKILLKYDPSDLSAIYVYDRFHSKDYIAIPAVNQDYASNLSLYQHEKNKEFARKQGKEVDIVALSEAKNKIQEIVERELKETKKVKSRKKINRLKNDENLKEENSEEALKDKFENMNFTNDSITDDELDTSGWDTKGAL